jgi:Ca2+-binding RTX toxin-like protein
MLNTPLVQDDIVTSVGDKSAFIYSVFTNDGNDKVNLSGAFPSSYYSVYTGAGRDVVTGGRGSFWDGSGNDVYHAKGDAQFFAGAGNDIYDGGKIVDSDSISFLYAPSDNGSFVRNTSGIKVDLRKTIAQDFGVFGSDTLTSIENAFGGDGNDRIYGTNVHNQLEGSIGNDVLNGFGDNDLLNGGSGKDILIGGAGGDDCDLNGDIASQDIFRLTSKSDSGVYSSSLVGKRTWDRISGFDPGGGATDDRIDLSKIDTSSKTGDQPFKYIGSQAFHANADWEVRVKLVRESQFSPGKSTLIEIDTDSDAKAEMSILVGFVTGLTSHDFIL